MNTSEEHSVCHYRYPRVSIIIPAYNADRWISEAMQSIQSQDYEDIEMIVIDDGSTDKTFWKASRYIYPHQRIIRMSTNLGACAAITEGFEEATGKYACVLAADDYYTDIGHIRKQVDVMEGTGADWCYDTITQIDGARVHSKWLLHEKLDNLILSMPWLCNILIGFRNPVNASSLMIRMSTYKDCNLSWRRWGDRSACDGSILTQMFSLGLRGVAIRKCGSYYRIHENQLSNDNDFKASVSKALDEHLSISREMVIKIAVVAGLIIFGIVVYAISKVI